MDSSARSHRSPSSSILGENTKTMSELPSSGVDSEGGHGATQVDGHYLLKIMFKNFFPLLPYCYRDNALDNFPEAS